VFTTVVKRLAGAAVREAAVYERGVATHAGELAPRLLAIEHTAPEQATLYLEALRSVTRVAVAGAPRRQSVVERVARVHARPATREAESALASWDYEAELGRAAALTLDRLEHLCARRSDPTAWIGFFVCCFFVELGELFGVKGGGM
jgi:hypothetical protein